MKPLFSSVLISTLIVGLAACSGGSAPIPPGPVAGASQTKTGSGTVTPSSRIQVYLSVAEAFALSTVKPRQGTYLTFTFSSNVAIPALVFHQTLPTNLIPEGVQSTCGGTATVSGQTITLTNGTSPCSLTVTVYGEWDGTYASDVPAGALTSTQMPGYVSNAVDATIVVAGILPIK